MFGCLATVLMKQIKKNSNEIEQPTNCLKITSELRLITVIWRNAIEIDMEVHKITLS